MGVGQSSVDHNDHDALNDTPVQFSQEVVNHLADAAAAQGPTPERQSSIDAQIKSRIRSELENLLREEQEVQREIERSLEKENLDQEAKDVEGASDSGDGNAAHKAQHSTILLGDLEEVKQKVDKVRSKRADLEQHPAIQAAHALTSCYTNNASRTLECWKEVAAFKTSVAQLEQDYIASFR